MVFPLIVRTPVEFFAIPLKLCESPGDEISVMLPIELLAIVPFPGLAIFIPSVELLAVEFVTLIEPVPEAAPIVFPLTEPISKVPAAILIPVNGFALVLVQLILLIVFPWMEELTALLIMMTWKVCVKDPLVVHADPPQEGALPPMKLLEI